MRQVIVLIWIMFPALGYAQCLDTLNFPDPAPGCNLDFTPVCGCDGITYKNPCFAEAATVQFWNDGPCEQIAMNIFPNPVTYWLNVTLVTKFESNVRLFIFDRNGNIAYSNNLTSVTTEYLSIPVNGFNQGLYIIMAESNGEVQLLKFIRWEEQF